MSTKAVWVAVISGTVIMCLVIFAMFAPAQRELSAEVEASRTILTVRNVDGYEWKDTQITINGSYSANVGYIPNHQPESIPLSSFTKSDGSRFDGGTTKVKTTRIVATTPKGRAIYLSESD